MRKRLLLLPLLVLSLGTVSAHLVSNKPSVLYADQTIDNVKIGDTFTVEQKTLVYNDESKVVDGQIILPDGTSKSGKQFTIEMPGKYTVNYRAFFGTHEESLSIFYHCHRNSGDFFETSEKSNPAKAGAYSHQLKNGDIQGAKLTLNSKTTFTYVSEIDFSSFGSSNPFIEFIVDTSKQNTSDLETLTIRLTDVEDNNNYVDISVTDSGPVDDDGRGCYILAGSNNQYKTGYEGSRLHISKYGANVGSSFRDLPDKGNKPVQLYFDYSNKELLVSPIIYSGLKLKITDLDDKTIYGSNIWEGFKSGKARLSIFASSLNNAEATLIVSKIGSQDLSPLDFVDVDAPVVEVDYAEQSPLNPPKGSINVPYKIFGASVIDNYDRNLSYSTYVTFKDTVNNKTKDISVINGTFTPKEVGEYTITYFAKDHSLNEVRHQVKVTCINDPQTMSMDALAPITEQLYTEIPLPSTEDMLAHVTGGSGKATITRTISDSNDNVINISGNTFVPTSIGDYIVRYDAVDYIGNTASTNLAITVTDPGHPIFVGSVDLPKILIKDRIYTLPSYSGVEVVNGQTVSLASKIYVNDVLLNGNTFTASEVNPCIIKYELTGVRGTEIASYPVKVIDCGNPINIANYFDGDFEKSVHTGDVTLSATSGNPKALFASVLPYDNPFIKFSIDKANANFTKLVIKYTDSSNFNNSITFNVRFSAEKAYISAGNDDSEYEFTYSEVEGNDEYAIDFIATQKVLKDIKHNELALVKFNDQGKAFNGFNAGVYLEISMVGVTSSSSIKVLTIANQIMGNLDFDPYVDIANPVIIFKDKFTNEQQYGTDAYVPAVDVIDVLSNASAKVTVKAPDGTTKLQNVDATVPHSFRLDQFGSYLVTYRCTDTAGNSASFPRKIVVYDFNPPVLTITGTLKDSYKLNDEVSIPSYTISDNLNDYKLDIFLLMPDNQQRLLMTDVNGKVTSYLTSNSMIYNDSFKVNETTFVAEQYGSYTMRFVAYDSDYNKTVQELHFEVK